MNKTPEEWAALDFRAKLDKELMLHLALEDIAELAAALKGALAEIDLLNCDNFGLAATACKYYSGDDGGSPWCLLTNGPIP